MRLRFASYNVHKGIGLDRKRDPERILSVLREMDADIIALQEVDRRVGARASVLPRTMIDDSLWRVVPVAKRPRSIGWHGNALLVRRELDVMGGHALDLPMLEPRGAVAGELCIEGRFVRIFGTHLDLSGLRRREQVRALLDAAREAAGDWPSVIMGDFNQWGRLTGAMDEFEPEWQLFTPGKSYPARAPLAVLDRIAATRHWQCRDSGVHRTALSSVASDHLPVWVDLELLASGKATEK